MPRGDRTGPRGLGTTSGRGLGFCAGDPLRGNAPGPKMDKQTEIGVLKVQAQELERVLKQINNRLADLLEEKQT